MDKFVTSAVIAAIFVLAKVIEAKIVKKEDKNMRKVGRDGVVVYVAALAGLYVGEIFPSVTGKAISPGAYTDAPEF